METLHLCKSYCRELHLSSLAKDFEDILQQSQSQNCTHVQYAFRMLQNEILYRKQKELSARLKLACLPLNHDLKNYDTSHTNGLTQIQFKQLCELFWLEQNFNIILMGPSGTSKTFLAAGLCHKAINNGYKAYFRTMEQIIKTLKLKDITSREAAEYKRLQKANLIAIDDIMLFPFEKNVAVDFFNFINAVYEKTAFIITTNKSPQQWSEMINDTVLVTALLDRLLYNCQVIKLSGESYRIKNRKEIFANSK